MNIPQCPQCNKPVNMTYLDRKSLIPSWVCFPCGVELRRLNDMELKEMNEQCMTSEEMLAWGD